jgi:putative alpha-1,2-mannosidase
MKKIGLYLLILTNVIAACSSEKKEKESNYTQYVNPFIGTSGHGHTFPGATMPFGMVQLSPDTRLDGWDGCSGYHYSDTVVYGFSHTHLSGTGVSDYGDVLLMPSTCCFFETKWLDKKTEVAEPGYYGVHLSDQNIKVDLTVTKEQDFISIRLPKPIKANIVLLNLFHRDIATDYRINEMSKSSISGFRISKAWAKSNTFISISSFPEHSISACLDLKTKWRGMFFKIRKQPNY